MGKKLKIFLFVLLILLFITCISVICGYLYFKDKINTINNTITNEVEIENKL